MAPRSQNPEVSNQKRLFAALVGLLVELGVLDPLSVESIVSLGSVPLRTIVLVPLTSDTRTKLLFKLAVLPSPIIESRKVELLSSSHPHALYWSQRQVTGNVWLEPF